jgi:hypothetical protein
LGKGARRYGLTPQNIFVNKKKALLIARPLEINVFISTKTTSG